MHLAELQAQEKNNRRQGGTGRARAARRENFELQSGEA